MAMFNDYVELPEGSWMNDADDLLWDYTTQYLGDKNPRSLQSRSSPSRHESNDERVFNTA